MQGAPDIDFLRCGVHRFRNKTFPEKREVYESLAEKQIPRALFLTCGDSRIDPSALTNLESCEIFVERTPGNIVPIYSVGSIGGVSASIEYSVVALGVKDIVVCGHSACGAMKGLLDPEELRSIPATAQWLRYAGGALRLLKARSGRLTGDERLKRLSQLNVIEQMAHLHTHPAVRTRVLQGSLTLHGWYSETHTGVVEEYNHQSGQFEELL